MKLLAAAVLISCGTLAGCDAGVATAAANGSAARADLEHAEAVKQQIKKEVDEVGVSRVNNIDAAEKAATQ